MSGEFEAVADAATGAMAAQAVDGTVAGRRAHGGKCLNCHTELVGSHCHGCGQSAHIHRTASALFHDIAHGVFHFEGRTWHTIPLLFWRPGELTRRYVEGERTRFVSPMALFLFSVFLMVAVFGIVGGPFGSGNSVTQAASMAEARTEAANDLAKLEKKIVKLQADKAQLAAKGESAARIEEKLGEARSEAAGLRRVATGRLAPKIEDSKLDLNERKLATGVPRIDRAIRHAAENPELTAYKMQSSAYKFSWALIPISLPFIWLLFIFRPGIGMYDHAIFATYSLSSMTLLVVALSIAAAVGVWLAVIWLVLLLFPPWHMYRQLKEAYNLAWWGAWWRMWALIFAAYTSTLIFFILLLAVGVSD